MVPDIHLLAPSCGQCGLRILGHGVESNGRMFCCASCAEMKGTHGARDRVDKVSSGKLR